MAEAKDVTPIRLLVAITLVAVAIAATGCLTGNGDDGPPAESSDPGSGGINPNPAVAVEPERLTTATTEIRTVYVSHSSDRIYEELGKMKLGVLYVMPVEIQNDRRNMHSGYILLEKSELDGVKIPFNGRVAEIRKKDGEYRDESGLVSWMGAVHDLPMTQENFGVLYSKSYWSEENLNGKYVFLIIQEIL